MGAVVLMRHVYGDTRVKRTMSRASLIATLVIIGALVGGAIFLSGWNIPPPSAEVEITLPDDRFPK